jgi:hypothetical protein
MTPRRGLSRPSLSSRHGWSAERTSRGRRDSVKWLSVVAAGREPFVVCVPGGGKHVQERAYLKSRLRTVPEQAVCIDGVPVAPTDAVPGEVARRFQVGHDGLDGALGEAHDGTDVAHPRIRVAGDFHKHMPVTGQQCPAAVLSVGGTHNRDSNIRQSRSRS